MFQNRARSNRNIPLLFLIILIPVIFAPMILHMIARRGADYQPHIVFALEMGNGSREIIPHPLFHLGVLIIYSLFPGTSGPQAGFMISLLMYIFLGFVIYSFYIRPIWGNRQRWVESIAAIVMTLTLMIVSALTILTWNEHNLYLGYVIPNAFHSPTMVVLRPLALLIFMYAVRVFIEEQRFWGWFPVITAAVLMILTSLAKPNYTISLLPALGLFVIYCFFRKQFVNWRLLILGLALPAMVVIGIQTWMLRDSSVGGGAIAAAPFALFDAWNANDRLPLKFGMSVVFPLVVYILYFPKARRDPSLNLGWLTFAFGAFQTYFLVESERVSDGNFIWSGQITVFVLFVVSAAFFLRQIYEPGKGFTFSRAAVICIVIWALHVASGVLWYATELTSVAVAERWW